ncbi:MAG: alanine racemase [Planctomycetota bacterium]|nr:MAG: alanine racemase [Planctomycetota bacterium]
MSTSRIEVDLAAVERNVDRIRRALSAGAPGRPAAVCAVLKADAYGLGARRVAKRLELAGVEMLAVYTPEQARALVEAAVGAPILLMMPTPGVRREDPLYRPASTGRLHFTVHNAAQLSSLSRLADELGITLPLHIEVDTGLRRAGAPASEALRLVEAAGRHARLRVAGLCTHFASADCDPEFTRTQLERFASFLERARPIAGDGCAVHAANSCGVFRTPECHFDMVRVGLALYGCVADRFSDPESCALIDPCRELEPVVRWTSRIVHLIDAAEGDPVGYGRTWRADRPTRLALVPVGFADGYPLGLSNRGAVGVALSSGATAYCPVAGRVSMDQVTIDVTDLPAGAVTIGTEVELIGRDPSAPNHLPALARAARSSVHELLSRLGPRVPRVYRAVADQPLAPASAG